VGAEIPRPSPGCAQAVRPTVGPMAGYRITLADDHHESIDEADAYQQEGPLTTFFSVDTGRRVIDCWSVRLASFKTAEIRAIHRV